jgi:hypothetical protein
MTSGLKGTGRASSRRGSAHGSKRKTPIGKPRTMGERMRDAGAREQRPAKKFKDGGKVKGFPDLNKDGMVRGCKPGQSSGTKFTGTF